MAKNQSELGNVLKNIETYQEQNGLLPDVVTVNSKTFHEMHASCISPKNKNDNKLKAILENVRQVKVDNNLEKPVCA